MQRRREREDEQPEEVVKAHFDPVNEGVVLAAAMVDEDACKYLLGVLRPEHFLVEQNRAAWTAMHELVRRKLDFDLSVLRQIGGDSIDVGYLMSVMDARPEAPSPQNLAHHVEAMHWDHQRAVAVRGPVNSLLQALASPTEPPERVRALARHVGESFTGAGRNFLREPRELVASVGMDLRSRMAGHANYPYGIEGLDTYEEGARNERGEDIGGRRRLLPGAAPGQVTVLTAVSGGGKSTIAAHMALGFARQKRRVLYGAWEPGGNMTMELLACIALEFSRTDMTEGKFAEEHVVEVEEQAHEISKYVVMMENPFRRTQGGRESNARNLDIVQQHIVDAAADVFIADLWERCLVDDDPSEEKRALFRQQAMAVETGAHVVLLAQQRIKDIETRPDKRPTREGVKGSSAYTDVADTMLAPHRPALFKKIEDNRIEVIVLKQRWGAWPMAIEFPWSSEFGSLGPGRTIPFEHAGEQGGELGVFARPVARPVGHGGGGKRRSRA